MKILNQVLHEMLPYPLLWSKNYIFLSNNVEDKNFPLLFFEVWRYRRKVELIHASNY